MKNPPPNAAHPPPEPLRTGYRFRRGMAAVFLLTVLVGWFYLRPTTPHRLGPTAGTPPLPRTSASPSTTSPSPAASETPEEGRPIRLEDVPGMEFPHLVGCWLLEAIDPPRTARTAETALAALPISPEKGALSQWQRAHPVGATWLDLRPNGQCFWQRGPDRRQEGHWRREGRDLFVSLDTLPEERPQLCFRLQQSRQDYLRLSMTLPGSAEGAPLGLHFIPGRWAAPPPAQ